MIPVSFSPDHILPPGAPPLLVRDRLLELIENPFQAKVTTIVAGAGYGKSTLAWQWADQTSTCVRWISLEPFDDDVSRFLSKLIAAGHLGSGDAGPDAYLPTHDTNHAGSIDLLVTGIRQHADDVCVVLDNCHVLSDDRCIDLLDRLMSRLPPNMSVVLVSRRNIPVRLSRLRAQGQVRDITASDLCLTRSEAIASLELTSIAVPDHVVDRWWTLTEGWVTGFRLATMSLGHPLPVAAADQDWSGAERFLDEYFLEEIIEPLPGDLRDLVLVTAGLPYITPELCAVVLEIPEGQQTIRRLLRDIPFLVIMDVEKHRYRFSPVFGESLSRLISRVPRETHFSSRQLVSAQWLLEHGELDAAAELALRSGDDHTLVHVFNVLCRHYAERSELGQIIRWLDRLPREVVSRNLNMPYWWIVARLGLGRTAGVADLVDEIEPRWLTSGDPLHTGRAFLCRGMLAYYQGDGPEADRRLAKALERLPQDAHVERLYATTYLGRSAFRRGKDEAAAIMLGKAGTYAARLPVAEQWSWRVLAPDRANSYALRGDLSSAITKYRLILSELPGYLANVEGFLRCRLIAPFIERHDLDGAWREFNHAHHLAVGESDPWHSDLIVAKARLLCSAGQTDLAEPWITDNMKHLRRMPEKNQLVLALAYIWLERREYSLVRSWLTDIETLEIPWIQTFGDHNHRLLAIDLDLAEERHDLAAQSAQLLAAEAASMLRWSEYIAFSVRAAVALHHLGRIHQSRDALRPAIERGARGGFVRHFQVPGVDVAWLFADVWSETPTYSKVRQSLRHGVAPAVDTSAASLTRREMEVLQQVAKGRSNQQIADAMYISINTVRNHLVNICRRLDASSRSEAVARARDMGILG